MRFLLGYELVLLYFPAEWRVCVNSMMNEVYGTR